MWVGGHIKEKPKVNEEDDTRLQRFMERANWALTEIEHEIGCAIAERDDCELRRDRANTRVETLKKEKKRIQEILNDRP